MYYTAKEIAKDFTDNPTMQALLEGEIRQLTIKVWFDAVKATQAVIGQPDECPNYPHDKY